MLSTDESFKELLQLTQTYLSQDEKKERWVMSSPEMVSYYKEFATAKKSKKQEPATVSATIAKVSTPPPPPSPVIEKVPVQAPVKPPPPPLAPPPTVEKKIQEPKPVVVEAKKKNESIALTQQSAVDPVDLSDIKKILSERFPAQTIIDEIPESHVAVQKATNIAPAIIILSISHQQNEVTFLNNLANAASICIAPTKVVLASKVDQQKAWKKLVDSETIKLILMNDTCLYSYPELLQYYRAESGSSKLYLGNKPLLLLSNIQQYLSQIPLKRALWKSIKNYDL